MSFDFFIDFLSEVNGCTQNDVAKPTIYSNRPRVCMKLRVSNADNFDDENEIQTEKQVYLSAYYFYYLNYTNLLVRFVFG